MSLLPSPTGMHLSTAAMVQAIHRAVVQVSYAGRCDADPAAIADLALPLQKKVRETILTALTSTSADNVNWRSQVFEPIIATFVSVKCLGVSFAPIKCLKISIADTDYVILLATLVILSYEILLLPEAIHQRPLNDFLPGTFKELICEPTVCYLLSRRLEEEQRRLVRAGAKTKVQRASGILRKLIPDLSVVSAAWKARPQSRLSSFIGKLNQAPAKPAGSVFIPSFRSTTFPSDLRVEIFLHLGRSMPFDFVESIERTGRYLLVKTCVGLRMLVEAGYTVSSISGTFDTVTLKALPECKTRLAATVIVPPGYFFRITDVDYFTGKGTSGYTLLETQHARMHVSNGKYVIKRRNNYRSVVVESNEC